MRAQKFADTSATLFFYGLPAVVLGMPMLAMIGANLPPELQRIALPLIQALAWTGYLGLPGIGLAGACTGLWHYFRKDYAYKVWKPVLVLVLLVVYVVVVTVATQAYRSMRHKTRVGAATPSAMSARIG